MRGTTARQAALRARSPRRVRRPERRFDEFAQIKACASARSPCGANSARPDRRRCLPRWMTVQAISRFVASCSRKTEAIILITHDLSLPKTRSRSRGGTCSWRGHLRRIRASVYAGPWFHPEDRGATRPAGDQGRRRRSMAVGVPFIRAACSLMRFVWQTRRCGKLTTPPASERAAGRWHECSQRCEGTLLSPHFGPRSGQGWGPGNAPRRAPEPQPCPRPKPSREGEKCAAPRP